MQELNHFRIYEIAQTLSGEPLELAREGGQVVCLGFDTARRRFVEIVALSGGDNEGFLERAETVASLQHPALSPVVESGVEENVAFYAVDLVDGEALESYAKRVEAVPFETASTWLLQIAEGAAALEEEGLRTQVSTARLALSSGRIAASLVDFGIVTWSGQDAEPIGVELARYLRTLTNYQSPDEEPVYPPEVESLCSGLEAITSGAGCVELLAAAGTAPVASVLGESLRPRLMLERLMFRRARPEHVMPPRLRPVQRAGEVSPYESVVEDSEGNRQRVVVLPPERFVSERLLDVFEETGAEDAVATGAFWKHDDFRLLAEDFHPGFDLGVWISAKPKRPASEVVSLLHAVEAAAVRLGQEGVRPRALDVEDVLVEFEDTPGSEVGRYLSEVPLASWPAFAVRIRTHPTMRSLAGPGDAPIPNGAEVVLENAAAGDALNAGDVFAWYFNLRNRGLAYQAGELVESLQDALGETSVARERRVPEDAPPAPMQLGHHEDDAQREDVDDEEGEVVSPIAAALGFDGTLGGDGREGERDDDRYTNPIAQNVGVELGVDHAEEDEHDEVGEDEFEDEHEAATPFSGGAFADGEEDPREVDSLLGHERNRSYEPASTGKGASILLLVMILLLSVAIAAGIAHISGRAFWQQ